ncbi:MAG TPA: CotH kinase family protein, partial [Chitinophagaceae bacterium]|nr:CotH kinase family protein [Chitinophagaceae bacterium]
MKRLLCTLTTIALFALAGLSQSVVFTSSNLPVIVINTNGQTIVDDPKITADMGIIFNASNARNNITDPFNHYNGKIGIEFRGQSSQQFPMKSYGIELRDNSGNSQNKSIFGMPKESDWILYAPYTDKTLMRNFLAYTMSLELGHWAAHCRFVELVVNGVYQGVYVFMEKIKWGSGRVNVVKMATTDTSGDALTGGYIFSLDKGSNAWYSSYSYKGGTGKAQFSYVYPKPENIVASQQAYIKSYVDSFENALYGPQFQDPVNGVRKFADVPSFIDYFIVNEVSRNVDGYRLSSYFNKDRNSKNSKIIAGPVWDYDLAFRNANYCNGSNTDGWAYQFNGVCPSDYWFVPFWWDNLMNDSSFVGDLRCRWKTVRKTSLSQGHVDGLVDSIANLLGEASQRHFQQWPTLGQYIWPNPDPIPTSYAQEISTLKSWINTRLQWIDANLPNKGTCYDYPPDVSPGIIATV